MRKVDTRSRVELDEGGSLIVRFVPQASPRVFVEIVGLALLFLDTV